MSGADGGNSGTGGRGAPRGQGGAGGPRRAGQGGSAGQGAGNRRRNEQGRERNRGGERQFSQAAPAQRTRRADPARLVAFEVLRAVAADDAYANLVLPGSIRKHRLDRRDAGFATELTYGALRGQGTYDAVLARCVDRPLDQLDPAVLDALRIGVHQILAMRVPAHAALDQTVGLVRAVIGAGPSSLVNAVLRKVTARDLAGWITEITDGMTDATAVAALTHSHPEWIVRALRQALVAHGRDAGEIDALLAADNAAPVVHLVALPGLATLDDALAEGAEPGRLAEGSAYYSGGDVSRLPGVAAGTVRVQDTGSQLVARALAAVELGDRGTEGPEHWLDLCAGPGGKTALLAAIGQDAGVHLTATEPVPHRAQLVRQALRPLPEDTWTVRVGDGRDVGRDQPDHYDRVLVDAPCTGLGALRRRPESRWRRKPADLVSLAPLQRELLASALDAVAPGGVVAYVTCSPHHAETDAVVDDCLRKREGFERIDAGAALDAVSIGGALDAGHGSSAQLWPHVHGTDAMYLALIRKSL
ncbi:transcription antitermination factor NusB [Arthrobacter agilis]|uniref:RsmB/NOP family class I SAM-dependent RNA methyltransferase n=1 Tax=Arthrobacter agilis TaxID=37921 RepID=UPI0023671604|nr:transcription antitermination factor NusB [Arthrobacter agilis]WDF31943.1 transcription antitermination factor NusB [Arthrobacter agilis]